MITTKAVFTKGLAVFRSAKLQFSLLASCGIFIPSLALSLILDIRGSVITSQFRMLVDRGPALDWTQLFAPVLSFVGLLIVILGIGALCYLVFYLGMVQLTVDVIRNQKPFLILPVLKRSLFLSLRRIFPLSVAALAVFIFTQSLTGLALIIAPLLLMAPVMMVSEREMGGFQSIGRSLTLKYTGDYAGFSVFAVLVTIGLLAFLLFTGAVFLAEQFFYLDLWLPGLRPMMVLGFPGLPFGPAYIMVTVLLNAAATTILLGVTLLSCALYFQVTQSRVIGVA
jgi:hypothetical protein